MSANNYRDLKSHIKKGTFDKAYLFSGQDKDRKEETIGEIESTHSASCNGSLAVIRVRSDEISAQELAAQLFTIPLFEERKLIVIQRVEGLNKACRSGLLDFVSAPPEEAYLVMCTDLARWQLKKKGGVFLARLEKLTSSVDFSPPREAELRKRAREIAEKLGFQMDEAALDRVLVVTEGDLNAVRNELEKLSLFVAEGGKAGTAEVNTVISRGGNVDVWGLADAMNRRDGDETQRILHDLLVSGEKPVQIVGALWYNMIRMAWCRNLIDAGVDGVEIGRRLNLKKWALRNYLSKAVSFNGDEYHMILNSLFELDIVARSRGGDIEPVFSRSLAEMVNGLAGGGVK